MTPPGFQLDETPLNPGVTLLEASAGTGKTYTITGLVLRLLAEKNIPINRILVVTFTEAATEELKSRIRNGIREACQDLRRRESTNPLLQQWIDSSKCSTYHQRLDLALASMDEARIHTILGFCYRILSEHSVETGFPPDLEVESSPIDIWQQLALDYWRNELYQSSALELAVVSEGGLSPESIARDYLQLQRHPNIDLRPPCDEVGLVRSRSALKERFARLKLLLGRLSEEALEGLLPLERFKVGLSRDLETHRKQLQRLREGQCTPRIVRSLCQLRASHVLEQSKKTWMKKHPDPVHPWFEACEEFAQARDQLLLQTRFAAKRYLRKHHRSRKESNNVVTFDDMISLLKEALTGTRGEVLQHKIQASMDAALIDEFQDTDPLQYSVFKTLFVSPSHYLYIIGDPKQAIYGFRGADIFSYLEAKNLARYHYTLNTNWRSSSPMVAGVNALFSESELPFIFDGIDFHPAKAAAKNTEPQLWRDAKAEDGLEVVFQSSEDKKLIDMGKARPSIIQGLVAEVGALLSGTTEYQSAALRAEHIAVLTRSNFYALEVREALTRAGIPAVVHSASGVFAQAEASELLQWIHCVLHAGGIAWLKGLLLGSWFHRGIGELMELEARQDEELQLWGREFRELRELWHQQGFMAAFMRFEVDHQLKASILSRVGGDRQWTNLIQIADQLNQFERRSGADPHAVLRWLEERIHNSEDESEEYLMRLEKDENAVTIMTMHKSKGLQFPVVFCPFLWEPIKLPSSKNAPAIYHDPDDKTRMVMDASPETHEEGQLHMKRELLAEQVRLFYVALTRAQCKTYLFWGDYKGRGLEAWSALLGAADDPEWALDKLKTLQQNWSKNPPEGIRWQDLDAMLDSAASDLSFPQAAPVELRHREFTGTIASSFNHSSFSSLTSGMDHEIQYAFEDESLYEETSSEAVSDAVDIFHLPGGTRTGDWFHAVMERISFESAGEWASIMSEEFNRISLAPKWLPVMEQQIHRLMHCPLPMEDSAMTLAEIRDRQLLREAPFHLHTPDFDTGKLVSVLDTCLPDFLKRNRSWYADLPPRHIQGFLKGFIDLVACHEGRYFILDWKSNQLGRVPEAYDPEHLPEAMCHSAYPLQYLIYTVALVRFLRQRIPDFDMRKHFGGVLYIFIRGIDPESPGRGVYFHQPEPALIEALDQLFDHG